MKHIVYSCIIIFVLTVFSSGIAGIPASPASGNITVAPGSESLQTPAKEARLKAKAEARAKKKAEARAKKKAEARAKAELKEKARAEKKAKAAAKKKEREEARAKRIAEKKAKEEARLKAKAEARAKKEAEARAEAEKKLPENRIKLLKVKLTEREISLPEVPPAKDAFVEEKEEVEVVEAVEIEYVTPEAIKPLFKAPEGKKWRISAGAIKRFIHSQSFKAGSYSASYDIQAKARDVTRRYRPAGDLDSIDYRNYINGYVYPDKWTFLDGNTWYWGYDRTSQIEDGMVKFRWIERIFTEHTRTTDITPGEMYNNSDSEFGFYLQAERLLMQTGWLKYGLHLNFSRVPFSTSGNFMTFRDEQKWATYHQYAEDAYSIADTGITSDSIPYNGTLENKGPVISAIPASRRNATKVKVSSPSYLAYNDVNQSLDMNLNTISLGMALTGNLKRLYLTGATGPTLNITETDASFHETLYESVNGGIPSVLNTWKDDQDHAECTVGMFVQGQLAIKIIMGFELGIFGRYDWIENVSGDVGQATYVVNPEGGSFGSTVNFTF